MCSIVRNISSVDQITRNIFITMTWNDFSHRLARAEWAFELLPQHSFYERPTLMCFVTLLISHFSPTKTCIIFAGCEGLNTASLTPSTPSTPGSSYNKYNSLDRRRLSKLSPSVLLPKEPPGTAGFMRLSAYVPNSEPKLRPYR